MKQMVMLEKQDVETMRSGATLTLTVGGSELILTMEPQRRYAKRQGIIEGELVNGHGKEKPYHCPKCGKGFLSPQGHGSHVSRCDATNGQRLLPGPSKYSNTMKHRAQMAKADRTCPKCHGKFNAYQIGPHRRHCTGASAN